MALRHAYAVKNEVASLAETAFTWGTGVTANRGFLGDGRMDKLASPGAAAGGTTLVIDFGAAVELSAIAVLNSNIADALAPLLSISAADDNAFTVGFIAVKTGSAPNRAQPRHKDHVLQFAPVTKRFWKLTWAWPGTFTLQVGEIFAGRTTVLSRAIIYGDSDQFEFIRSRFQARSGETRGHFIAGPIRLRELPFDDLSSSERDELMGMYIATKGGATPLLWCEQYEASATAADADHQDCIFGAFEDESFGFRQFDYGRFQPGQLKIRSKGREVGS